MSPLRITKPPTFLSTLRCHIKFSCRIFTEAIYDQNGPDNTNRGITKQTRRASEVNNDDPAHKTTSERFFEYTNQVIMRYHIAANHALLPRFVRYQIFSTFFSKWNRTLLVFRGESPEIDNVLTAKDSPRHLLVVPIINLKKSLIEDLEFNEKRFAKFQRSALELVSHPKIIYLRENELCGVPKGALKEYKRLSWNRRPGNEYSIPVDRSIYQNFIQLCESRYTRECIHEAYMGIPKDSVESSHLLGTKAPHEAYLVALLDVLKSNKRLNSNLGFDSPLQRDAVLAGLETERDALRLLKECFRVGRERTIDAIDRVTNRGQDPTTHTKKLVFRGHSQVKWWDPFHSLANIKYRHINPDATKCASHLPLIDFIDAQYEISRMRSEIHQAEFAQHTIATDVMVRIAEVLGIILGVDIRVVQVGECKIRTSEIFTMNKFLMRFATTKRDNDESENGHLTIMKVYGYGYIYLSICHNQRNPSCYTTLVDKGHVYIQVAVSQLLPWNTNKRMLNMTEISAIAHEVGHGLHILCRGSNASGLRLDLQETPSIVLERLFNMRGVMEILSPESPKLALDSSSRGTSFYSDIVTDIAIRCYLNSTEFDPFKASPMDLLTFSNEIAQRFSMWRLPHNHFPLKDCMHPGIVHPRGLNDCTTFGYLVAYIRAGYVIQKSRHNILRLLKTRLKNNKGSVPIVRDIFYNPMGIELHDLETRNLFMTNTDFTIEALFDGTRGVL